MFALSTRYSAEILRAEHLEVNLANLYERLCRIHMLIMLTGRERTLEEYAGLLEGAGWKYRQTWYPASRMLGVVEGVKG
jgi:hypothetical protein